MLSLEMNSEGEFLSLRFQSWVPPFRGKAVSWERHLAEWQGSESTACPWGSACRAFVLWRIQSCVSFELVSPFRSARV